MADHDENDRLPARRDEKLPAVYDEAEDIAVREDQPVRRKRRPPRAPAPLPAPLPPPGRGCMGTCALFGGLSLLVITLVLAFMMLAFTHEFTDFLDDPVDNMLEWVGIDRGKSTPEVADSRVVVLRIQDLALLETTRGDILVDTTVVQEKTFVMRDAKLRVQYLGRVTAGVDLSLISESDVVVDTSGNVTVNLPPAQITGCYLREPEIIENTCGTNVLGMANCSDTYERLSRTAYERAKADLLQQTDEQDILGMAIENAESAVADLLRGFGYADIRFNRSTETLPPDDSCLPA